MRLWWIVAVVVLAVWGGRPAPAQAPADEALAVARELVAAAKTADQIKTVLPLIMQQLKPVVVQGRPAVEKDFDAIVPTLIATAIERANEMIDLIAQVYVRNFTVAEMRDVVAFYRTPTGQKLLEKMPVIMQQSMAAGQQFAQIITTDLQKRMIEELRKRGHDVRI